MNRGRRAIKRDELGNEVVKCKWCKATSCYHCPECGNTVDKHKPGCKADPAFQRPIFETERDKPSFLAHWEKHEIPENKELPVYMPPGEMGEAFPGFVRCPTEEEIINCALLMMTMTREHRAHVMQQFFKWPDVPGSLWINQLEAILPYVRRILKKRGIEWKDYTNENEQIRNKKTIKKHRKAGLVK